MAKPYFPPEVDRHINEFNRAETEDEKHAIFDEHIRPAFEKLIESLIFVYHFYNSDDVDVLKQDAMAYLYETLSKFDPNRGTKAFSYFNVVSKNYLGGRAKDKKKRERMEMDTRDGLRREAAVDGVGRVAPLEAEIEAREFWKDLEKGMGEWKSRLHKKQEHQLLEAIKFLISNPEMVPLYNKKAVYLYLREMTGLNTKAVVSNLKTIRACYEDWKLTYHNTQGMVIMTTTGSLALYASASLM